LTVEEGTPFAVLDRAGDLPLPDEDEAVRMFEMTGDILAGAGYEQYEIANFALPGSRSRHNQVYWRRGSYLSFGAGAHSFLGWEGFGVRWQNPDDLARYRSALAAGELPAEPPAAVARADAMAEWIFLGLRMREGVDGQRFQALFGTPLDTVYGREIANLTRDGLLEQEGPQLRLTLRGVILSNRVFAAFL